MPKAKPHASFEGEKHHTTYHIFQLLAKSRSFKNSETNKNNHKRAAGDCFMTIS